MNKGQSLAEALRLRHRNIMSSSAYAFGNPTFKLVEPVPSDIDVSQSITPRNIAEVAAEAGILPEELVPHGDVMAKVKLSVVERLKDTPDGNYVVVTGINPTPLGEGKSSSCAALWG